MHTHFTSQKHTRCFYKNIAKFNAHNATGCFLSQTHILNSIYTKWLILTERPFQQQLLGEYCNCTLLVPWEGPQECLNMLVSICKHTSTEEKTPTETKQLEYKFCPLFSHWTPAYIKTQNIPLRLRGAAVLHQTHSMTCIDLCTAVVFSLTKSDFPIPSCGSK